MRSVVAAAVAISTLLLASPLLAAQGGAVSYEVGGKTYEGYYVSPRAGAPLVLLIHNWDGLGDYEVKRSQMRQKRVTRSSQRTSSGRGCGRKPWRTGAGTPASSTPTARRCAP